MLFLPQSSANCTLRLPEMHVINSIGVSASALVQKCGYSLQLILRELLKSRICALSFREVEGDTFANNVGCFWILKLSQHECRKPISKRLISKERHRSLVTPQVLNTVPTPCRTSKVIHDA